jgi:hypothetical protein
MTPPFFLTPPLSLSLSLSPLVPLYMTQKYRDQMTVIITNEINRVYNLFIERNPDFVKDNGKVSILGHSLGVCG